MKPAPAGSLLAFLQQIPDPRGRQGLRHPLKAMLASVVCAFLQGARGYSAIAQWVHAQEPALWHALGYTRKPPQLGAFRDLLMEICPKLFEQVISAWVAHCLGCSQVDQELEAVALDGKSLCGTLQPHERAVHLLSLLDHKSGSVLSQTRVDAETNEAKAALELLKNVVLKGRVITGDAMFCQREVCQQILDSGGHYFFVVKRQPAQSERVHRRRVQGGFFPRRTNGNARRTLTWRKRSTKGTAARNDDDFKPAPAWQAKWIGPGCNKFAA